MFCRSCGKELNNDAVFCNSCGQKTTMNSISVCPSCGSTVNQGSAFCSKCGKRVDNIYSSGNIPYYQNNPQDASSGGFAALGFFFPVVGLILYLVWKDIMPLKARSAGKGALAGIIAWVAVYVIYFIALVSLF